MGEDAETARPLLPRPPLPHHEKRRTEHEKIPLNHIKKEYLPGGTPFSVEIGRGLLSLGLSVNLFAPFSPWREKGAQRAPPKERTQVLSLGNQSPDMRLIRLTANEWRGK